MSKKYSRISAKKLGNLIIKLPKIQTRDEEIRIYFPKKPLSPTPKYLNDMA
jgi:hypothetical protein